MLLLDKLKRKCLWLHINRQHLQLSCKICIGNLAKNVISILMASLMSVHTFCHNVICDSVTDGNCVCVCVCVCVRASLSSHHWKEADKWEQVQYTIKSVLWLNFVNIIWFVMLVKVKISQIIYFFKIIIPPRKLIQFKFSHNWWVV